jgi:hypothetical protein
VLGLPSPVPRAAALSAFEAPAIDDYHLCLHLACDDEPRLAAIEAALTRGTPLPGAPLPGDTAGGPLDLSRVLRLRQSRTGFVGTGLPASRQDVSGIPGGHPVPGDSPLFMGFKSGGPFAGGTTMHVRVAWPACTSSRCSGPPPTSPRRGPR